MYDTLTVKINKKSKDGVDGFEGTVEIPGLSRSKVSKKDGTTFFASKSSLNTVAKSLAKRLDLQLKYLEHKAPTCSTVCSL